MLLNPQTTQDVGEGNCERFLSIALMARGPVAVHCRVGSGEVKGSLLHYTYTSLDQYFEKFDRYSRWWAEQNFAKGRRGGAGAVLFKPPARFVGMYLLKGGFRDGARGLVLACLAAASVMAKYARLWERSIRK